MLTHYITTVAVTQAPVGGSEELGFTTIRSPIRGIALSREVEIGSAVSLLGDMDDVYVKVSETDIGKVKVGLPARITVS